MLADLAARMSSAGVPDNAGNDAPVMRQSFAPKPQAREAAITRHMLINVAGVLCVGGGMYAIYENKARARRESASTLAID